MDVGRVGIWTCSETDATFLVKPVGAGVPSEFELETEAEAEAWTNAWIDVGIKLEVNAEVETTT